MSVRGTDRLGAPPTMVTSGGRRATGERGRPPRPARPTRSQRSADRANRQRMVGWCAGLLGLAIARRRRGYRACGDFRRVAMALVDAVDRRRRAEAAKGDQRHPTAKPARPAPPETSALPARNTHTANLPFHGICNIITIGPVKPQYLSSALTVQTFERPRLSSQARLGLSSKP